MTIGKDDSSENSELIRAWLAEAERAKVRLGYVRQDRQTKASDYGEYTQALYSKGDMYFKTFLQYQRVQGAYGRHSLQYTYYAETGSDARRTRRLELVSGTALRNGAVAMHYRRRGSRARRR